MPDDFAGGHHFQVSGPSQPGEIEMQVARLLKMQQEREGQLRTEAMHAQPDPSASPLAEIIRHLGAALEEQQELCRRLYGRLESAGVLCEPAPVVNDLKGLQGKEPIPFRLGQVLDDYHTQVLRLNQGLSVMLEQLAL